jgi:hypothetical protein
MIRENAFSHPDDLSKYGLSERLEGLSRHNYELEFLHSHAVVIDHATGLMWQQSGAPEQMNLKRAGKYIKKLNQEQYGGYSDWRLPTIEELASLLEPAKKNGDLYIDPVFDPKQRWCWTADHVKNSFNTAWIAHFLHGNVSIRYTGTAFYVRGVRSIQ